MEQDLSTAELYEAVKHFKDDKTPGVDGFVAAFYKIHWDNISNELIEAYNYAFEAGRLHDSAKRGILSLLPKKGKEVLLIKNWHPLTMLTLDYKILSKVLDNRLKPVLARLIQPYQTGFMEGRYILTNILKMSEIMGEMERKQLTGILMSIDFEKCFDMIEHTAINGALNYFGFGPKYKRWLMLLFTDFEICTQNNGMISNWISPTRGLHQGCYISPHIYNLVGQLFADLFTHSSKIKGILLREVLNLLSQFADDTSVYLDGAPKKKLYMSRRPWHKQNAT